MSAPARREAGISDRDRERFGQAAEEAVRAAPPLGPHQRATLACLFGGSRTSSTSTAADAA